MLTGRFQLAAPDGEARRARPPWSSGSVRARERPRDAASWTSGRGLAARGRRDRRGPLPRPDPDGQGLPAARRASSGPWPGWAATSRAPTPTTRRSRSRSGATGSGAIPGELKNLLRNQAFVAGIGNAYSDEILHAARAAAVPQALEPRAGGGRRALRGDADDARRRRSTSCASASRRRSRSRSATSSRSTTRAASRVRAAGRSITEVKAGGFITSYCRGCQR